MTCISSQNLRINDKNGDLMVLLLPTLSDDLRVDLASHLELIYPDDIKITDSSIGDMDKTYISIHADIYNRYHTSVSTCPSK